MGKMARECGGVHTSITKSGYTGFEYVPKLTF